MAEIVDARISFVYVDDIIDRTIKLLKYVTCYQNASRARWTTSKILYSILISILALYCGITNTQKFSGLKMIILIFLTVICTDWGSVLLLAQLKKI
jgi:hypothetical protein